MNLEALLEYLDNTSAYVTCGLTRKKVERRGEKFSIDDQGIITFEMDRHHPVGGTQYSPGARMSAMITQRYRYFFNPQDKGISDESIGEPRWDEKNWDWLGLAENNLSEVSFTFTEIENDKFEFSESCVCFQLIVSSPEEAITAFRNEIKGWDFSLSFEDIDNIRSDTKAFLCRRLQTETVRACDAPIREAWEDREMYEEE